jgi:putative ABC transport system substrate-binding protein
MDRRRFLLTALAGALAVPRVEAQQVGKVCRIGLLDPVGDLNAKWLFEVFFRQEMTKLGYIEGKSVFFEYQGHDDLLPGLARELVNLNPDVLVTAAGATRAAKEATATIPIVMATVLDPVASGYVASLARPGGNVTGSTEQTDELRARCEISGPDPIASPKGWEGSCNSSRRETNRGAAGGHPARRD